MKNLLLLTSLVAFTACTVPNAKPPKTIHVNVPDNTNYSNSDAQHNNMLTTGMNTLSNGKAKEAILNYFNPIIKDYENNYASTREQIFTARTQKEHDKYMHSVNNAKILSETWSEAYYLKAYALLELKEINEAQTVVKKALNLAPSNSKYLSEFAHIYQLKKEFKDALRTYTWAETSANLYTPKSLHQKELLRAKRGMGYNLIELKEFNKAENIYKQILKILPHDEIAIKELKYIQELKKRR